MIFSLHVKNFVKEEDKKRSHWLKDIKEKKPKLAHTVYYVVILVSFFNLSSHFAPFFRMLHTYCQIGSISYFAHVCFSAFSAMCGHSDRVDMNVSIQLDLRNGCRAIYQNLHSLSPAKLKVSHLSQYGGTLSQCRVLYWCIDNKNLCGEMESNQWDWSKAVHSHLL